MVTAESWGDTLNFYSDPGHGWLEVDFSYFRALGLNPQDFSQCSYRKRNVFYLEEDCDAPKFIAHYEKKHGVKPTLRAVHVERDIFVRRLPPIW